MGGKKIRFCLVVLVFVFLFFSVDLWAQPSKDEFQQGLDAASAGQYDQALTHFLRAEKAGLKRPALDYNLGVAYFKLGHYEQARKSFMRLTDDPDFKQIAYFNLGLVANKAKDEKSAVAWFQRAYAGGSDENIKLLSAQALRRLKAEPKKFVSARKPWSGFVNTLLSHDSNVTLVNDDLAGITSTSDNAFELLAAVDHWLQGSPRDGLKLSLSADAQMYATNSQYDFSFVHAGLSRFGDLGNWNTDFGLSWDEIYFDGLPYQRIINAEANGRHFLSKKNELRLRYRLSRIQSTDARYDYLDGWRQQWRVGLWARAGNRRIRVYYQLELNNRNDYTSPAGNFTSFSPTRHTLQLAATLPLISRLSAGLDARYRFSIYNDPNDLVNNTQMTREDSQYRLGGHLTFAFAKNWEFETGYSYTKNNSNVHFTAADNYSYRRSLLTAGVNWFF